MEEEVTGMPEEKKRHLRLIRGKGIKKQQLVTGDE